ncbi:transmembrane protein 17A isoform X2 [Eucyclogobius newberryi]|uniref:transmembrane protein 17A isoform X2 n=1 Tax=Eucyclogobius newberryi TaxID=166745 RepID=UPI003B5BD0BF
MPVFHSPLPENLHMGLAYMGSSVFTNNRTADSDYPREQERTLVNELMSHLPLQMLLYFNMFYFPCWWFSAVFMLNVKVPELAAFWVLSFTFPVPVLLFFLTDEDTLILPLERATNSMYLLFVLAELTASFLALRTMTRKLLLLFHLRQLGKVESLRPAYGLALPYHRGVLTVTPIRHMYHTA